MWFPNKPVHHSTFMCVFVKFLGPCTFRDSGSSAPDPVTTSALVKELQTTCALKINNLANRSQFPIWIGKGSIHVETFTFSTSSWSFYLSREVALTREPPLSSTTAREMARACGKLGNSAESDRKPKRFIIVQRYRDYVSSDKSNWKGP